MEALNKFTRQFLYTISEAFTNIVRSGWMCWVVISTMVVSLSVLSGFWLIINDVNSIVKSIGSQLQIIVFLNNGTNSDEIGNKIEQIEGVAQIKIISKAQAWEEFQQEMKGKMEFSNLTGINPLPDTIQVTLVTANAAGKVAQQIQSLSGIEEVKYSEDLVRRLREISNLTFKIGILITAILSVATLAIVVNTIRLAVNSRRNEIDIMRLVGASNWFIRMPFLLEGLFFGLISSIFSGFVLAVWRYFSFNQIQNVFPFLPLTEDYNVVIHISGWMILIGIGMGLLGSMISIHRYLGEERVCN